MTAGTISNDVAAILLRAQRAQLQALLTLLPSIPEEHRQSAKAGAVQALGALEDALGLERTIPRKAERSENRVNRMERGKALGIHLRDVVD